MQKLILLGGGGHCKSCIDVIEQQAKYEIVGVLDKRELIGEKVLGYEFVGTDDDIKKYVDQGCEFLITLGQIRTSSVRRSIYSKLVENNAQLASVVSPRAYVSKYAKLGKGTIIMHDALVNASVAIGENCIINSKALIEHDSTIGDFCHISTSAVINGGVRVNEGTFFGSNAVSKECAITDNEAFIKAGAIFRGKL